ncbi:MAG TPA: D-alanyl-D-alanine carboxypeptidase [candidate division WWE3 bacterium]|uniref:D-alanyl-D-alanine carboxypeptidase n=1 Tax=candidate division WWE3 bacterium TaxID=2053526 RepID=A0A7C1DJR7_UNCKA|nr:D-alanyl-D-alanine carboxypeptidase [candidate division WWE3 bacterium]
MTGTDIPRTILGEILLDTVLKAFRLMERRTVLILMVGFCLFHSGKTFSYEGLSLKTYPVVLGNIAKTPHLLKDSPFPKITAQSVLVADLNTTRILHEKDSSQVLAPASTTKLMTALVSLDLYSLTESIPAPRECLKIEGNRLELSPKEALTTKDLLHALLISSSNDAACILANSTVPEEEFVKLMNFKATQLGLLDTKFTNPIGFDSYDFTHKSTAKDLYKLALYSRSNPVIKEIYSKSTYTLYSGNYPRTIYSTNPLLIQLEGSVGMKTGTTTQAGEVFIYEFSDDTKDLLIILMGSKSRFSETREILQWIEKSFSWY